MKAGKAGPPLTFRAPPLPQANEWQGTLSKLFTVPEASYAEILRESSRTEDLEAGVSWFLPEQTGSKQGGIGGGTPSERQSELKCVQAPWKASPTSFHVVS